MLSLKTKVCIKCNMRKNVSKFVDKKNLCKMCMSAYSRQWRDKNKKKLKEYRLENKVKIKEQAKKSWLKHRIKRLKEHKEYYKKNRSRLIKLLRKYYYDNLQRFKDYKKNYYKKYRKEILKKRKIYRIKNKAVIRATKYQSKKKRLQENPNFRLREYCRNRVYHALKKNKKSKGTMKLMGLKEWTDLWEWLEPQFYGSMTRENYGSVWVVHHIEECKKFDMTDPKQQRKCFHYTNLKPLLIKDHKKIHSKKQLG